MTKYAPLTRRIEIADETQCGIGHSDIAYTHLRHLLAITLEVIKRKKLLGYELLMPREK